MVAGTEQKASELSDLINTVARAVPGEGMGAECWGRTLNYEGFYFHDRRGASYYTF